ncbi:hypothetical protein [Vallitalea sp.]|uniref:hypothetical protein n=1 Tax=Vallitalea sp. TaxID=1882829 RepID=UPI0025F0B79C|nr:hypothetical protein [Vallitalea sp.]MCT4686586.1 transposase [Vallitalea sp.]
MDVTLNNNQIHQIISTILERGLYSIEEVCRRSNITQNALYTYVQKKGIPNLETMIALKKYIIEQYSISRDIKWIYLETIQNRRIETINGFQREIYSLLAEKNKEYRIIFNNSIFVTNRYILGIEETPIVINLLEVLGF